MEFLDSLRVRRKTLHITSPNRRLVDMVNIIILQDKLGLVKISEKSKRFRDKWMNLLDYINEQTKSIKKVQNDCELLQLCALSTDDKVFKGFVMDTSSDTYSIYLPKLKMVRRFKSTTILKILSEYCFRIYIFMDEKNIKQKIKIVLQT